MSGPQAPLVRLEKISKSFGDVHANRDIDLDIHAGRIKAILGENGAGKSTLMAMLAGQLQPDGGRILIDGRPVRFTSTRQAIHAGIGMVYQHFKLVEAMTVAENLFLSQEKGFWLSHGKMVEKTRQLAARYHMTIDPAAKIADLSMGERQRVEILKLLRRESRVLIFDEPTAVLTPPEIEQLFRALREMAQQGKAIVFISHKLDEVMDVADEIAILRRGRIIDQLYVAEVTSKAELARRMVGKEVLLEVERTPCKTGNVLLEVEDLQGEGLRDVNLRLCRGEILGIVGVAGNGQKSLVEIVCGLQPPAGGRVRILGSDWKRFYATHTDRKTLSYIPEDRQGLATCLGMNLVENFLLTTRLTFSRGVWLQRQQARSRLERLTGDFDIQPPNVDATAGQLSGGNLQKLVLAREFFREPRVIVAEQPTQGLDVAATEEVWKLLLAARQNAGILLITGDLAEALALCDRVAVMFGGRIVDTFPTTDAERVTRIGAMMAGLETAGEAAAG